MVSEGSTPLLDEVVNHKAVARFPVKIRRSALVIRKLTK